MSEEEIIERFKILITNLEDNKEYYLYDISQKVLDLYNEEKEKNNKAIEMLKEEIHHCRDLENGELYDKCKIQLHFNEHLLKLLEE